MAQNGFSSISLYYSNTPGASPIAANMANGELALQAADGKLFYKDSGGAIKFFTSSTNSAGGANTNVQFNNAGAFDGVAAFTYTTGTSTLSVPTAIFSGTGAITTPNGTTAQRPGTPSLGMLRYNSTTNSFEGYGGAVPAWGSIGGSSGSGASPVTTDFTATAAQTVFGVAYPVGNLEVYRNGIKLGIADYTATNGTTFTLATPAVAGDLIEAVSFSGAAGSAGVSSFSGGTTGFTPAGVGTGVVTLGGTLVAANGGTGLTSPGAAGNVLTSDGTNWTSAAPGGGGGGWTLIETKTANNTSPFIEFTGLAGYDKYAILFENITSSRATDFLLAFIGTGATTYITSGYKSSITYSQVSIVNNSQGYNNNGYMQLTVTAFPNTGTGCSGQILLQGFTTGTNTSCNYNYTSDLVSGPDQIEVGNGGCLVVDTSVKTAFRIRSLYNFNLVSGKASIYGIAD